MIDSSMTELSFPSSLSEEPPGPVHRSPPSRARMGFWTRSREASEASQIYLGVLTGLVMTPFFVLFLWYFVRRKVTTKRPPSRSASRA
jgi:hypothetical protein